MLNVTERAASGIEGILVAEGASPGQAVKLVPDPSGGIGITIAEPAIGDEVVRRGDDPLLIVDAQLTDTLDGAVLDVVEPDGQEGSPRFTLRTP